MTPEQLAELIKLKEEYLATLDDDAEDEFYGSKRDIESIGTENFIRWLNMKNWTP